LSERNDKPDGEDPSGLRPWPLQESETLHEFSIYHLRKDKRRSPRTGKVHTFLVLDATDWINVVPVTPEGNIVMVRQFRHGTASFVWEIPGGMVDPADATPQDAARRELLEETGYEAEGLQLLGVVHPNPAIQNNLCHTFLARNVRPRRTQKLDGSEDIAVQEFAWTDVPRMINEGRITHSLVIAAVFWYQRFLSGQPPPPVPSTHARVEP